MRPSKHETMLEIVRALEKRTTCIRRGVGCVLVNRLGEILSTGYNGVARGELHCNSKTISHACTEDIPESGTGLDLCKAIHAEQNALLQCSNVEEIYAAYISCTPCIHCIKLLMNTSCELIVAHEEYDKKALELWMKNGERDFIIFPREQYA